MKSLNHFLYVWTLLCCSVVLHAQPKQYTHPSILSFENSIAPAQGDSHSQLTISTAHFKHLTSSLDWKWNASAAQWSIKQAIGYIPHNSESKDNAVSTFVFWIYAKDPIKEAKLKVEFLKNGRVCSFFEYGLNFTGWRGAWIAFNRDMQGKPEEGMDEMRVTAPSTNSGELFFDHIILSSLQDVRQHTADFQAPYINPKTDSHWLILLRSWQKSFDIAALQEVTLKEKNSIAEIQNRLTEMLLEGRKATPVQKLSGALKEYQIQKNVDGTLCGLPVFFERFGETYEHLGAENYKSLYNNAMGLSNCLQLMFNMAVSYNKNPNPAEKETIAAMYVLLMRHLLDQGFQAGSGLGTLHHLGYSMRNFYTGAFLMKDPLRNSQLDSQVQQAMEWFVGTGEVKTKPTEPGMDIDAFNTSLVGRISSILMMNDTPEKTRYLRSMSRWIDNGFAYSNGVSDAFKPDGSLFHHCSNYPPYGIGGLTGAVIANTLLYGTDFQLKPEGRQHLKDALIAMRNYCNLQTWPISLSGRHPDGKGHLLSEQYAELALTGSPDYKDKIDTELAGTYLRIEPKPLAKYVDAFTKDGIKVAHAPNGNWSYNYSCLAVHRRDNWSVTAMGHSRYLWATESYAGANLYGRYLNHGSLEIRATGNPISNFGSGFRQEGWDWNHFPGTTAAVRPMTELRADVKNLDSNSGYEEMLFSDEAFAGSISLQNKQGAFAMKLHEHDKYNGSLRARKSVFFFDNRIVSLGSNIVSKLPNSEVNTTLFQVYLPTTNQTINVNGAETTDFPYSNTLKPGKQYVGDGLNNYFFVFQGDVLVTKSLQHSLDQETDKPTQNNFAMAAINHGSTPKNASYEYMVLVQPTKSELTATAKQFVKNHNLAYKVLEQDSDAHIVYDIATKTTAYVLFNDGKLNVKSDVYSASLPCMIMTSAAQKDKMAISVCDPDLHLYKGKSDDVYDENGKRMERSVYSRTWLNNISAVSEIEVVLNGNWKFAEESAYILIKKVEKEKTTLTVKCQHGFSREAILVKE